MVLWFRVCLYFNFYFANCIFNTFLLISNLLILIFVREKTFNIKDFLFNLKEILARINIDQETQIALKEVIKRFVFIHLFHCKYVEIFNVLISSDQRQIIFKESTL